MIMTYVTKAAIAWFFFYNLTCFKVMHLSFDESYREREIFLNCDVTQTHFRYEINNTITSRGLVGAI